MKRKILAIIGAGLLLGAPLAASAKIVSSDSGSAHLSSSQTVNDDLYMSGSDVIIEGTVNGDVFVAGQNVTIKGTISGDVFVAGQNVNIGGKVKGGVRAAGQNVHIQGATIGGGVSVASSNFTVVNDVLVGGGVNFGASTAIIRAPVTRGIVGGASLVTLGNKVGKDVIIGSDKLVLDGATLNGDLTFYGNDFNKDKGSKVLGKTQQHRDEEDQPSARATAQATIVGLLWYLASLYLVGAVLLWLMPKGAITVAETILRRPFPSLGWGLLAMIVAVPVIVILMITLVGIPLALVLAFLFGLVLYLSTFFAALAVGGAIARRFDWTPNPYVDSIIGLVILALIGLIPVIGLILKVLVVLFGLGAVILALHNHLGSRDEPIARPAVKPAAVK